MKIDKKKIPRPKNNILKEFLEDTVEIAKEIQDGYETGEKKGLFDEGIEIAAYEILRASGIDEPQVKTGKDVYDNLHEIFRDNVEGLDIQKYIESGVQCLYGLLFNNYTEEDFRFFYRYSLYKLRDSKTVGSWLRKSLVIIALAKGLDGQDILEEVRWWIRFLGAPLWSFRAFLSPFEEFEVDLEEILADENLRLVDSLRKYPEYLEEAVHDKSYLEVRDATKDWLPDVLSSDLLSLYKKSMYQEVQKSLKPEDSVDDAHQRMRTIFDEKDFKSTRDSVLPVRLHELEDPPPADAIDPVVFELIPQKLRVNLVAPVAYSTTTKNIEIIFIGGPRIGNSAILIKTETGGVLFDYGLSVANQQIPEWVPELEMIDCVLVSHSHLDHMGGLPVLFDKYEGKWCSTAITGAITKLLLEDALKVGTPLPPRKRDKLDAISRFTKFNVDKVSQNHVSLEYGKSSEVSPGIVVTPVEASHIQGSAAYVIDIEGVKILYTGDFNTDESVLFQGADLPTDCDYTIFDGTYWGREDFDRQEASKTIYDVVNNHGPVIIPSFAVGRTQEILRILEKLGVTERKNVITAGLAEKITKLVGDTGKWESMKKNKVVLDYDDVLVAGGGMMSGGFARHHFNEHRTNPEAAVILCGYLAPRTPGWNLYNGYEPADCRVEYARISGHSSASNLRAYTSSCKGKKIMVHTPFENKPRGIHVPEYRERMKIKV